MEERQIENLEVVGSIPTFPAEPVTLEWLKKPLFGELIWLSERINPSGGLLTLWFVSPVSAKRS